MLRIFSIFRSIDGEINRWGQGTMCTFIRFAGCNLNCDWCDTKYARDPESGSEMSVSHIMEQLKRLGCRKVTVTGGEPYEQLEGLMELVSELQKKDYMISIETNGTHEPVMKMRRKKHQWGGDNPSHVMDYKLLSSGMTSHMKDRHFRTLTRGDFVKFVIQDRSDFALATYVKTVLTLKGCAARFAFSSVDTKLHPRLLLEWMDKEELYNCILNVQLHKLLELKEDD